jgi:hypothetical protein
MITRNTVKAAVNLLVAVGTGTIIGSTVRNNVNLHEAPITTKVPVVLATSAISVTVAQAVRPATERKIDDIAEMIDMIKHPERHVK